MSALRLGSGAKQLIHFSQRNPIAACSRTRLFTEQLKMAIDTTKTVREFVLELPSSTNVFEQLGIDYCCGGQKPLAEACAAAGKKLDNLTTILERLQSEQLTRTAPANSWV